VAEVEAADAGAGLHGQAFGDLHADVGGAQQREQRLLDAVVGAGGVAGRGADALVLLVDQLFFREALVGHEAPQVGAHAVVQPFGAGLGQAVGQGLEGDGAVVVVRGDELGDLLARPMPAVRRRRRCSRARRWPGARNRPGSGWGSRRRRLLLSVCWRRPCQVIATSRRDSSA
jgi:hypothetical protein